MWKNVLKGFKLVRDFFIYFQTGWKNGLTLPYVKCFFAAYLVNLNHFRHTLYMHGIDLHSIHDEKLIKLRTTSEGLHTLLPKDSRFTYSVLIVLSCPQEALLKRSLEAVFNQSVSSFDVLIAYTAPLSQQIEHLLREFKERDPLKMQIFEFSEELSPEDQKNHLARHIKGKFLFFMGEDDWARPDLLYRYEQTLRLKQDPQNCVLYCNYNRLNAKGAFLPCSEHHQPTELCFPYVFKRLHAKGLLVPTTLWKMGGILYNGVEDEGLLLDLDLQGATFQHVPLCLYSVFNRSELQVDKPATSLSKMLENYTQVKGLGWKWSPGYLKTCARALPALPKNKDIQVIIPFKDQKKLTLQCVRSLLKQQDVRLKITAVDNRSSDHSIAEEIKALGGEVLFIDEPYNYSRLNNLAVKGTQSAGECETLLFLNNDVELESDALAEMLRWVDQPGIGMVGCRLNYPNGRLQHGGVRLVSRDTRGLQWEHIEKHRTFDELNETKSLHICDAVTAACAMMKRKLFLDVEGFDEIWYPIGYSDTNMATKIKARGLKCFYTPYAVGVHHESVSRKSSIEDFESSVWLHRLWQNDQRLRSK